MWFFGVTYYPFSFFLSNLAIDIGIPEYEPDLESVELYVRMWGLGMDMMDWGLLDLAGYI